MDVAEAFAWGQKFQLGYGKHPPLSGWVAGLWFRVFPVADWATYALAMATLGCGLVICWLIALRVVDRRRAFFVVVMLALYPIFNFKGFKYNPDLLQLVTLPLVVLAYLNAFEKRSVTIRPVARPCRRAGADDQILGADHDRRHRACGADPSGRLQFLRSPAPWVAIATLVVAMMPHLVWLKQVDFVPLTYAGDVYAPVEPRAEPAACARLCRPQSRAARVADRAGGARAGLVPPWWRVCCGSRRRCSRAPGRAAPNPGVNRSQALNVWIIQAVVAIGPPLGALGLHDLHEDRLGNLAVLPGAAGAGRDPGAAPAEDGAVHIAAIWLVSRSRRWPPRPGSPRVRWRQTRTDVATYGARSELARELTRGLARAFQFTLGRGRGHHGNRRADDVLQSRSSGAVHAGRTLVVRADLAGGSQAARLHRRLRSPPMGGCRSCEAWMAAECRRTPSAWSSPRSASSTAIRALRSAGRSISRRRRSSDGALPRPALAVRGVG